MQMSAKGRAWLQGMEGLRLVAYRDAEGFSIGYGHYGAREGQRITKAEADALFAQDLIQHEQAVTRALTEPPTQAQFDALVSFSYNVGTAGMAGSTVVRRHNARDFLGAASSFDLWRKSRGKDGALTVNPVLVARRDLEEQLYATGVYSRTLSGKGQAAVRQAQETSTGALWWLLGAAGAAYWLSFRVAPIRRMLEA